MVNAPNAAMMWIADQMVGRAPTAKNGYVNPVAQPLKIIDAKCAKILFNPSLICIIRH